jgi:hypothetical protein
MDYFLEPRDCPTFHDAKVWTIDEDSWIIGDLLVSRQASESSESCWADGKGAYFTITEAPSPLPPLTAGCPFRLLRCNLWRGGMWEIGEAVLEVTTMDKTETARKLAEVDILNNQELTVITPRVIYEGRHGEHQYMVFSIANGERAVDVWNKLAGEDQDRLIGNIACFFRDLSTWRGSKICRLDGSNLDEATLSLNINPHEGNSPEELLKNCKDIGMDCSNLVFMDADLMPCYIRVDCNLQVISIDCPRKPCFAPKDWIRTKLRQVPNPFGDDFPPACDTELEMILLLNLELKKMSFPCTSSEHNRWCAKWADVEFGKRFQNGTLAIKQRGA